MEDASPVVTYSRNSCAFDIGHASKAKCNVPSASFEYISFDVVPESNFTVNPSRSERRIAAIAVVIWEVDHESHLIISSGSLKACAIFFARRWPMSAPPLLDSISAPASPAESVPMSTAAMPAPTASAAPPAASDDDALPPLSMLPARHVRSVSALVA